MSNEMWVAIAVAAAIGVVALLRRGDGTVTWSAGRASDYASVEDALRAGQKIAAIKLYREQNAVGLREAKEAVEAIQRTL